MDNDKGNNDCVNVDCGSATGKTSTLVMIEVALAAARLEVATRVLIE